MDQLSGLDAVFLSMETPSSPAHMGGMTLLDPSGGRGFSFERLRREICERLPSCPRFTRKLQEVPLGLDLPYWVEDPSFDVDRHLRRIALPAPGGTEELNELVGWIFSQPLDRDHPLWEIWLIEGLAGGRSATLMKLHHCLMDGVSGAGLAELLCDPEPEPRSPRALGPAGPTRSATPPGPLQMALRAAQNAAARPAALLRHAGRLGRAALGALLEAQALPFAADAPRLPFNTRVGRRRAIAFSSVSLEAVQEVRRHFGVTVNDVLLALSGSALRQYLEERGQLPAEPLVAIVPVSTRSQGDLAPGNQITEATVCWATDRADPVERLLCIHASSARSTRAVRRNGSNLLGMLGESLPPGLVQLAAQLSSHAVERIPLPGNAVVSTVRATPFPLYMSGARVECMVPLSVLAPSQGLNITAVSYCGRVDFGFIVDPDRVPQHQRIADGIGPALEELQAATREHLHRAA